jgi:hypothetical protein
MNAFLRSCPDFLRAIAHKGRHFSCRSEEFWKVFLNIIDVFGTETRMHFPAVSMPSSARK